MMVRQSRVGRTNPDEAPALEPAWSSDWSLPEVPPELALGARVPAEAVALTRAFFLEVTGVVER